MESCLIVTERLCLRQWLPSDTEPFALMNRDSDVMKYFPKKLRYYETVQFIKRINDGFVENSFGLFAVERKLSKEFIGFTGFAVPTFQCFFTPCVEIGWRYKKESWGQGFATEAAIACLNYGFNTLQFDKVVSFTASVNIKSGSVMTRIGMKHIADFNHPVISKDDPLRRHVFIKLLMTNTRLRDEPRQLFGMVTPI